MMAAVADDGRPGRPSQTTGHARRVRSGRGEHALGLVKRKRSLGGADLCGELLGIPAECGRGGGHELTDYAVHRGPSGDFLVRGLFGRP